MHEILVAQRKRIIETSRRAPQLRLELEEHNVEDEVRQLDANRRHWERRLEQIEHEIEQEPERIRRTYDVTAERLEPIGLAYLWPVTG